MANLDLKKAKKANNNEFYTQWCDIQKEIMAYIDYNPDVFHDKTILLPCDDPEWSNFTKFFAQNFEAFGLKKLISTSFAYESKKINLPYQPSLFEQKAPQFNPDINKTCGKIFTLDHDTNQNGVIDIEDLEWKYLDGDGDFRSDEVKKLRDEADIIITNPPFNTLFKEFWKWLIESKKQFLIIASINSITYNYVFPYIKRNEVWLGTGMGRKISGFIVPDSYELYGSEARIDKDGNRIVSTNDCLWFTNIEHGKRHQPLRLMSMAENLKFNNKLLNKLNKKYNLDTYPKYDNYDAIEIPITEAIPSDYDGVMGVPVTFLDKYCPEQFEIIGLGNGTDNFEPTKIYKNPIMHKNGKVSNGNAINRVLVFPVNEEINDTYYTAENTNEILFAPFARILIKRKK